MEMECVEESALHEQYLYSRQTLLAIGSEEKPPVGTVCIEKHCCSVVVPADSFVALNNWNVERGVIGEDGLRKKRRVQV